ncbi:MAG: hypothetical protein B7X28_07580 [Halothiobacillus sp. 13-55-253]|nr:MAG: hypothetical protein B7X37_04825 [Halothiobacillus sp. 14-55-98]OZB80017.1 MAG: hypothetical protein B7X28_07580 [Halothiobacillus sp. 13-55-253]
MNHHRFCAKASPYKWPLMIGIVCLFLTACGQKGPLVMPSDAPASPASQNAGKS